MQCIFFTRQSPRIQTQEENVFYCRLLKQDKEHLTNIGTDGGLSSFNTNGIHANVMICVIWKIIDYEMYKRWLHKFHARIPNEQINATVNNVWRIILYSSHRSASRKRKQRGYVHQIAVDYALNFFYSRKSQSTFFTRQRKKRKDKAKKNEWIIP